MEGDKSKSPSERDSEAARRALLEQAMLSMGQNPFGLAASDPTGAYAQLAAAQMSAYQAMMARHPAFAAAPYGGLGMFPEGLASPLHSAMGPAAFMPGFGMYGNPFLMAPYSSMITATTTSSTSSHSSPLKQSGAKTTVTSSTTSRSSPAATVSKSSGQSVESSRRAEDLTTKSSSQETTKSPPTVPPPAHASVIKSTPKSSSSKTEESNRDSDDDFLAKEVLNHLKNQQAEFLRREQELKLQHTAESKKSHLSTDAQRELTAELMRKRQHEQLVNQLKSPQYDAMPNLKRFAEQQLQKHKHKGKEGERNDSKSEQPKKSAEPNTGGEASSSHEGGKEQQEYASKKKVAEQIREHVQKKSVGGAPKAQGRTKMRAKAKTLLKIPNASGATSQEQKLKQDELRAKLEAELKLQQLQLKMAKKVQREKQNEDKTNVKEGSKLAQVLLGKAGSQPFAMQVETSPDRPLVATFKTLNAANAENDEISGSSSDSASSDSDDSGSGLSDSDSSSNSESTDATGNSGKRKAVDEVDSSGTDGSLPAKKQKPINEEELRIPLEHGWRRETRIRTVGQRGIVGDVVYYAPCGKVLKNQNEISKYLGANGITDLTKENFGFNTRASVGDFLELSNDGTNGMVSLSEQEVQTLLHAAIRQRPAQRRAVKRTQLKKKQAAKIAAQEKVAKRMEQQEIAKLAMEHRHKKKVEKEQKFKDKVKLKQMREVERHKQKERFKMLRQREKQQRLEELRMEREMRTQQLMEDREMKRQQAIMLKEQERERRKHMLIMVGLERERRRQHLILLKALEARKKMEERERQREEKNRERIMMREKKMEQRRMEIQMAYEMKRPVDDLRVKEGKELPKLDRIPGVKLPGQAFADTLMVLEFLHNFSEALNLDSDVIPTLNGLQMGILNQEDSTEELMTLLAQLLKLALEDPGVPNPKEAVTKLHQKIADIDINDDNVSEVLRIFMEARNGKPDELSKELNTLPFLALNSTSKAACLAFLCNELLSSSAVVGEIEEGIDNISNLRKDKWSVEGKLRSLKGIHAKKINRPVLKPSPGAGGDDSNSAMANLSKQGSDEEEEESGNESGGDHGDGAVSDGEENSTMTVEELEKKIDRLSKQQGQFRSKVFDACRKLRAVDFGLDRYKRRYWVLPHAGGIFIEGVESGDVDEFVRLNPESNQDDNSKNKKECADGKNESKKEQTKESETGSNTKVDNEAQGEAGSVQKQNSAADGGSVCNGNSSTSKATLVNGGDQETSVKMETSDVESKVAPVKQESVEKSESSEKGSNSETSQDAHLQKVSKTDPEEGYPKTCSDLKTIKSESVEKMETPGDVKPLVNGTADHDLDSSKHASHKVCTELKIPSFSGAGNSEKCSTSAIFSTPKSHRSATETADNRSLHDKTVDSLNKSSLLLDSANSSKMEMSSDGSMMNPYLMAGMKSDGQWFSILPKIACDDKSTAVAPAKENGKPEVPSSSAYSSPFGFSNSMFSPIQMGQMHGSPFGYGMMPMTSSPYFYQSRDNSTRAPSESSMDCSSLMLQQENLHQEARPIPTEMQAGWWRITDPNQFKGILRCMLSRGYREKHLQRNFQKNIDFAIQHCGKGSQDALELEITAEDREISQNASGAPSRDKQSSWNTEVAFELERSLLEDVEALEERVFNASLQVKGWKLPGKVTEDENIVLIPREQTKTADNMQYIMEVAKQRLAALEQNIERRYLKPPLNKASEMALTNHSRSSPVVEDDLPKGLVAWRESVATATSPSQLSLCMVQMNSSISWEKSVMKVLCQICRLDDNEAELLLCDSCDKGYHTYCFKPPMTDIPDGDWFCYECVSRASKAAHCIRCGKKSGRMAICNNCPVAFHIDCIDPPFQRTPRKWICGSCSGCKSKYTYQRAKHSKARKKLTSESNDDESSNVSGDVAPTPEKKAKKSEGSKAESTKNEQSEKNDPPPDFSICWSALSDLEQHPDSKPFATPVNCKKFPSYRKFIKKPMDFSTLRKNLNNNVYKATSEFASDVRQIFENCEVFNEDDSDVGIAGHTLRKLFEDKWTELTPSN